ncbi:NAD synthetase [Marinobacter sp. M1N3S26]|uniref:NAD synthetase n=1 Tax=Marinobacter sp. M1N3S26 TaxID=3382299 RepID=UPI00387AE295
MSASLPLYAQPFVSPFQNPYFQSQLKRRLETHVDLNKLFKAIDSDFELSGAGVVYIDARGTMVTLREFEPICQVKPVKVVLVEPISARPTAEVIGDIKAGKRESKLAKELLNAGLSCGAAILGWAAVIVSTGAVPVTGGTSTAVTVISYSAAAAGTAQCGNGIARSWAEHANPEALDEFDNQEWYQYTQTALDVVSVGGAVTSGAITVKLVMRLRSQQHSLRDILYKRLNRNQRKRLTEELIEMNQPGISAKMRKHAQRYGLLPKRYSSTDISRAALVKIKESLSGMLSLTGSATSGVLSQVMIGIYREYD